MEVSQLGKFGKFQNQKEKVRDSNYHSSRGLYYAAAQYSQLFILYTQYVEQWHQSVITCVP